MTDIEKAVAEERKAIVAYIEHQNKLINTLFDNPHRHDAFVADICEGILKRGQ